MTEYKTLYNEENALEVANKGDYVEILFHNGQPVSGCRWWYRGGVRYKKKLYKPRNNDYNKKGV
ncbi:MAG: hypothetical protein MJ066_05830 [Clostridia bacterium]|nr:hypothetical protein [Clostridia bacterium]